MADYWLKYGGPNINNMTNWGTFVLPTGSNTATFSFTINSRIKLEFATPFILYVDTLIQSSGQLSGNWNFRMEGASGGTTVGGYNPTYLDVNRNTDPGGWFYIKWNGLNATYQWKITLTSGTCSSALYGRYTYGVGYRIPTADAAGTVMDKNNKCKLFREMNLAIPYSQITDSKPVSGQKINVSDIEPSVRFGSYSAPTAGSKIAAAWQNEIINYLGNGTTRYTN